MVIVIMGDVESCRSSVGRLLAEYLGWEFEDLASLHRDASSRNSLADVDCTPDIKALYAVIDSLNYEWRDVILSCSISNQDDQTCHYRHPLVKFVYLKPIGKTENPFLSDRHAHSTSSGMPVERSVALHHDDRLITVDFSQGTEQILKTVLSELVLK